MNLVWVVALGGALGATSRHFVNLLAGGMGFAPSWGTLGINVLGSTAAGALLALMAQAWSPSEAMRAFLFVGVLGGFTTFSAFSAEVVLFIERGEYGMATLYAIVSMLLSVGGLFAGLRLMRVVLT